MRQVILFIAAASCLLTADAGSSVAYKERSSCGYFCTSRDQEMAGGAVVGGAVGLVAGLAVGALQKGERWTRIPLNATVAFHRTASGRFALTVTRSL